MIGDTYFELRARLGTALYALSKLGQQVNLHPARVSLLQNLIAALKEPFLFVVAGEVNSGKSTFLNGLFGHEFCETDVVPKTSRIHYFRFGTEVRDIEVNETLVELYRPCAFLKDFHILDTPGTNSVEDRHQEITERYIPMADLVIFVFPVTNPWGAANWDLLEKIHHRWFKNVIFVLQQCDLRDDREVATVLEHMRTISRQRMGVTFPTFCVSAKKALLAKTVGVDKEGLWRESHFEELERFTSQAVSRAENRIERLLNTVQTARVVLGEIRANLSEGAAVLHSDKQLLDRLERAVLKQKMLTEGKFVGLFESFDNDFMNIGMQNGELLESRITVGRSLRTLFGDEDTPQQVGTDVARRAAGAARERVGAAAETIKVDLLRLWKSLGDYVGENSDYALPSAEEAGLGRLVAEADALVRTAEGQVAEDVEELEIGPGLQSMFAARRRMLRALLFLAMLGFGSAIGLALTGFGPYHLVSAGMAVVSLLAMGWFAQRNAAELAQRFARRLEGSREGVENRLKDVFKGGVDRLFRDFIKLFDCLRSVCAGHRDQYQPQIEQIEQLARALDEIELRVSEVTVRETAPQPREAAGVGSGVPV